MASIMYSEELRDYRDLENATGKCPGYLVEVGEKDGGIGLHMYEQWSPPGSAKGYSAFMSVEEAKALVKGLQEAIDRAAYKQVDW